MDVSVTSGELFFTIDASTVRFPSLKLEDLDIPAPCYNNFLQNQTAVIYQHTIPMVWCHILPSMKKGKIVSISHELPDDGPFKSYKDIKRHWKNHYGYRLPEDEDDMIYYQINFRPIGEKLFTYPEICLRARDIQRVPRVDPKPILLAFLQDLQKKMPKICGFPLKLHSKACYPSMDLAEVTKIERKLTQQNLTSKPPSKNFAYRKTDEIQRLVTEFRSDVSRDGQILQSRNNSMSSQKQLNSDKNISQKHQSVDRQFTNNNASEPSFKNSSENSFEKWNAASQYSEQSSTKSDISAGCLNTSIQSTQENKASRIVPSFKTKGKVFNQISQTSKPTEPFHKVVPVFKPTSSRTNLIPSHQISSGTNFTVSQPAQNEALTVNNLNKSSDQRNSGSISVPVFSSKKNISVLKKDNVKHTSKKLAGANIPLQIQRTVPVASNTNKASSKYKQMNTQSDSIYQTLGVHQTESLSSSSRDISAVEISQQPGSNQMQGFCKTPFTPKQYGATPKTPKLSGVFSKTSKLAATPKSNVPVKSGAIGIVPLTPKIHTTSFQSIPNTPSTPAMKRPYPSSNESTPAMKKPRPKQQIQDVNVEMLARSFQLGKVNTVTLVAWLKEKGAVCKAKDKKGDLVEKAMKLLNLTVSEQ